MYLYQYSKQKCFYFIYILYSLLLFIKMATEFYLNNDYSINFYKLLFRRVKIYYIKIIYIRFYTVRLLNLNYIISILKF